MKKFILGVVGLIAFCGLFSVYGYGQNTVPMSTYINGGSVTPVPAGSVPVGGPGLSTDYALVAWNGTTGNLVRNTTIIADATGSLTIPNNGYIGNDTTTRAFFGGSSAQLWGASTIKFYVNSAEIARFVSTHLLLGGLTTDGTGTLQFPTATTSAGGVAFSTDTFLFRSAAHTLDVSSGSATNATLRLLDSSVVTGVWNTSGTSVLFDAAQTGGSILFRTNGNTTALTLDSSQNATFAGSISFSGGNQITSAAGSSLVLRNGNTGNSLSLDPSQNAAFWGSKVSYNSNNGTASSPSTVTQFVKAVTAIADNSATAVLTVTIPNAAHSARLHVELAGSLGAGGAIGANEAKGVISYDFSISRTAGVNAVMNASAAYGSASSSVAGGATITVTAVASAVSGAVGASNSFTVNVTIARGSGTSTNHTCQVRAEIINANATGITLS